MSVNIDLSNKKGIVFGLANQRSSHLFRKNYGWDNLSIYLFR